MMFRVYRKLSDTSDRVKEIFMGTMDLQIGDIVKNDDSFSPEFVQITDLDKQSRKTLGQIGIHTEPCDDPRGRLADATSICS
jgi:hypothetical protein